MISHKPLPALTFGTKFEVTFKTGVHPSSLKLPSGWDLQHNTSKEARKKQLKAKVTSPVLQGDTGMQKLRQGLNMAAEVQSSHETSCLFQVHVGVASKQLNLVQMKSICEAWILWEKDICSLIAERFHETKKSQSNNRALDGMRKADEMKGGHLPPPDAVPMAQKLLAIECCKNFQELKKLMCPNKKRHMYYKLNLHTYEQYGTFEFRLHQGIVDPDTAEFWVRFLLGFVEHTRKRKTMAVRQETILIREEPTFEALFDKMIMDDKLKTFALRLREKLHETETERRDNWTKPKEEFKNEYKNEMRQ